MSVFAIDFSQFYTFLSTFWIKFWDFFLFILFRYPLLLSPVWYFWCACSSGDVYKAYFNPKKKKTENFYGKTIDKRITQNQRNENMNDSIILIIIFCFLSSCCSAYFFWFLSQILLFVIFVFFSQCIFVCYLSQRQTNWKVLIVWKLWRTLWKWLKKRNKRWKINANDYDEKI